MTVISLGAKVSWRGQRVTTATSPALRGTAIEIDFRPGVELQDTDPALF